MRDVEGRNRTDGRTPAAVGPPWLTRRRFVGMLGSAGGLALGGGGLAALLDACSSGGSGSGASSGNRKMTMAVFQEPDTLDPSASGLITVGTISQCLFDHLVWSFPGRSGFVPGLATSWEVSSDATAYTFHLR